MKNNVFDVRSINIAAFFICLTFILYTSSTRNRHAVVICAAAIITVALLLVIRGKVALKRLLPAVFMSAMFVLINTAAAVFAAGGQSHMSSLTVRLNQGLGHGLLLASRVACGWCAAVILFSFISVRHFFGILKWMHFPAVLREVLSFAIKFVYLMYDEGRSSVKARRSRLGYSGVRLAAVSTASAAGSVLIRSYDRSLALARAMKSRGYAE